MNAAYLEEDPRSHQRPGSFVELGQQHYQSQDLSNRQLAGIQNRPGGSQSPFSSNASQNAAVRQNQPKQKYLNFAQQNPLSNQVSLQFSSMERREGAPPRKSTLERIEEEDEDTSVNWSQRRRIFVLFVLGNLFLNYDNGVIPACLIQIEKDLKLGQSQMALMGSLVYFGLSVSSLFVSIIFQKVNASYVLGFNMIANAVACFVFSFSSNWWVLASMRFMLGFT